MLSLKTILVPTDYSTCAEGALMHALHLADKLGAEVHLLHVQEDYAGPFQYRLGGGDAVGGGSTVGDSVARWNGVAIRYYHRLHADPTAAILEHARREDVDLIVLGTHGNRSMDRFLSDVPDHWIIGATAEQIVKTADRPVFAVGPRSSRRPDLVEAVLVPVDFSRNGQRALRYGVELARLYGAELRFLHVVPAADARSEAARRLRALSEAVLGPGSNARVEVRAGRPADVILDVASGLTQGLVVLGSHGQHTETVHPLGRDVEHVIRAAPCPVFVDRVAGKSLLKPKTQETAVRPAPLPAQPML